jgi:hypothetical protein
MEGRSRVWVHYPNDRTDARFCPCFASDQVPLRTSQNGSTPVWFYSPRGSEALRAILGAT